jgi:hypothetical protein
VLEFASHSGDLSCSTVQIGFPLVCKDFLGARCMLTGPKSFLLFKDFLSTPMFLTLHDFQPSFFVGPSSIFSYRELLRFLFY